MAKFQRQQSGNPEIQTWHALAAGAVLALIIWFTSDHTPPTPEVVQDVRVPAVDCADPLNTVKCLGEK
jgi:hypothetical protein